jgi:hypothetical protein
MATFTSELWLNIVSRTTDFAAPTWPVLISVYAYVPMMIYVDAARRGTYPGNAERWAIAAMLPGVWLFAVIGYFINRKYSSAIAQPCSAFDSAIFVRFAVILSVDLAFIPLDQIVLDNGLGCLFTSLLYVTSALAL